MKTFYFGPLWIDHDKDRTGWNFIRDKYSLYRREIYIPHWRFTWLRPYKPKK